MRWIDKSEVQFIHWLSLRKILQLSVNNSTDDSESSGDHNLEYNPRRHRAFPLSVPAYIPGTSQRSNELEYLTSYNCWSKNGMVFTFQVVISMVHWIQPTLILRRYAFPV